MARLKNMAIALSAWTLLFLGRIVDAGVDGERCFFFVRAARSTVWE
jgi:hypothetical protein